MSQLFTRSLIGSRPPSMSIAINRESNQARGLIGWWPAAAARHGSFLPDLAGGHHAQWDSGTPPGMGLAHYNQMGISRSYAPQSSQWNAGSFTYSINQFSVSAWVTWGGGDRCLVTHGQYLTNYGYYINISSSKLYLSIATLSGASQLNDPSDFPSNVPTLATIVKSGTSAWLYVNGIQVATTASIASGADPNTPFYIAAYPYLYGPQYWSGYIGEVRLYSRALTPAEVFQQYNPPTRWDLYQPIAPPRFWSVPTTVAPPSGNPWYAYQQM